MSNFLDSLDELNEICWYVLKKSRISESLGLPLSISMPDLLLVIVTILSAFPAIAQVVVQFHDLPLIEVGEVRLEI